MKFLIIALSIVLLAGCASSSPIVSKDATSSIKVTSGTKGCQECKKIKLIESEVFYKNSYRFLNEDGAYKGERIEIELSLVVTNRSFYPANRDFGDHRPMEQSFLSDDLFQGQYNWDGRSPYRLILRSKIRNFGPPKQIYVNEGIALTELTDAGSSYYYSYTQKAYYRDYHLPRSIAMKAIEDGGKLQFFVGEYVSRKTGSVDGLRPSFENFQRGFNFEIELDVLGKFIEEAKRRIENSD